MTTEVLHLGALHSQHQPACVITALVGPGLCRPWRSRALCLAMGTQGDRRATQSGLVTAAEGMGVNVGEGDGTQHIHAKRENNLG